MDLHNHAAHITHQIARLIAKGPERQDGALDRTRRVCDNAAMPIFRVNSRLIYFCHVPKAAGSALEAYLAAQFGHLAFVDQNFHAVASWERWNRSSPQHIDVVSLERLFPQGFFDVVFAVVRHPVARLVSAFRFQKFVEGKINVDVSFNDWVSTLRKETIERRWMFDNHLLPMRCIVPQDAHVFRLEDGLDAVVEFLQELAGPSISLPRTVVTTNVTSSRLAAIGVEDLSVEIDRDSLVRISEVYREDFERFGYSFSTAPPGGWSNEPVGCVTIPSVDKA